MIKGMYTSTYTGLQGVKRDYDVCLDDCKNYIRERNEEMRGLTGDDFGNKVKDLINFYILEARPVVPEMVDGENVNVNRLAIKLYGDINEYGPITAILSDPESAKITDLYCDDIGPGGTYIMRGRKREILRDANGEILYFKTPQEIEAVSNKLSFSNLLRLSKSSPILYAQTIQGWRLTSTDSSISGDVVHADGTKLRVPTFSIRFGRKENISLHDMVYTHKTIHPEIARALKLLGSVEHNKVLFSGVPGTGKTTLLAELLKELTSKRIFTIERTGELNLKVYDRNGVSVNCVKSCIALKDADTSGDTSKPTVRNLFLMSLREKVDILVLGESRSTEEISVMMEAAVAGQGVFSSIHGEDEVTTLERLVKDVGQIKKASRQDAMEEAYLALNLVISMYVDVVDRQIRVQSISEIVKETTPYGEKVVTKRLYDFTRYKRGINPETGLVCGNYRKVGVPSERLQRLISMTDMTEEDEEFLMQEASPENPIVYSEKWGE